MGFRLLALILLAGCAPEVAQEAAEAAAETTQEASTEVVAPVVVAVQSVAEVVAEVLPEPAPRPQVHSEAVALIVRYEVSSQAYYQRRLQGVICPGGASGPTWGIGYDGGHQSAARIRREWAMHPEVERLATASGVTGDAACRAWRGRHLDIRVPLALAQEVFDSTMMPTWLGATRRTYPGVDLMTGQAEGALVSNSFNRGTSMLGDRAREKRVIRDTCVPMLDAPCTAQQLRAQCRIWQGTTLERGLCARRESEGLLAEST